MKRLLNTKIFIAVVFFCLGFFANHLLTRFAQAPMMATGDERYPSTIDNFDNTQMTETIDQLAKERATKLPEPESL